MRHRELSSDFRSNIEIMKVANRNAPLIKPGAFGPTYDGQGTGDEDGDTNLQSENEQRNVKGRNEAWTINKPKVSTSTEAT